MAEPRRVRHTPVPYEAVQWTGDNADAVIALAGSDFDHDAEIEGAGLCTSKHSSWEPLYVGDWVLKAADGSLSKVDGDEFDTGFEDVPALASGGIVETSRLHRIGGRL